MAAFIIVLFCILALYIFSLWRRRRILLALRRLPGPLAIPVFGNTYEFKLDRVAFSYQMEEILKRYEHLGVVRLWIGEVPLVVLTRPETVESLLTSSKILDKTADYFQFLPWLGEGLLVSSGEKWRFRRKMLTSSFHFQVLSSFIDIFNEQASVLCQRLREHAKTGCAVNIPEFTSRCTLDIICETAMGVKVNAQQSTTSSYVAAVYEIAQIIYRRMRSPWLWWDPLFYLLGYGSRFDRCLKTLKSFTKKVVEERTHELQSLAHNKGLQNIAELEACFQQENRRLAFLDRLLLMRDENRLTDEDIREEVDTFMFEGHDTTSTCLSWTLFAVGHHSEVQQKICEELNAIFGNSNRNPTADDLKAMKYLEAVIKESMRIYPPVPLYARRVTEDFVAGNFLVPAGVNAMVLTFALHRSPDVWGDDVEDFKPDRFFNTEQHSTTDADSGGQQQRQHCFKFVPFSAGPRNCIGQKFAMLELKCILSAVFRRFEVTSSQAIGDVRPVPELVLRPPNKILLLFKQRND